MRRRRRRWWISPIVLGNTPTLAVHAIRFERDQVLTLLTRELIESMCIDDDALLNL
jgi:hypothetical protein